MQPAQPSAFEMMLPFLLMIAIFYFLVMRPQSKRAKQQEQFLNALKRGDNVVTTGGIFGTIDGITDQLVTLEIAKGVKVQILRRQIAGSQQALTEKKEDKKG